MFKTTLQQLNGARRDKQPVLLATDLHSGKQALYFADGTTQGFALTEEQVALANQVLHSDRCKLIKTGDEEIFYQPFNPPLRMIIVGAVHIAKTLVPLASLCNYQVIVIDPRKAFADDARFPHVDVITDWPDQALENLQPDNRTAIITLSHDPKLDEPALAIALRSGAFYIGSLGSKKTQLGRQQRLLEKGFTEQQQARINGPIGLNIGARSPAEIAVAIMAQVTETLNKGEG